MRTAAVAAVLALALTACGAGDDEGRPAAETSSSSASSTPSPAVTESPRATTTPRATPPPPSPDAATALRTDCAAAQPILTEVNDAATDAGGRVITATDAAAIFQQKQAELGALAAASSNAGFTGAGRALADSIGRVRVAVLEGGDVGGAVNGYLDSTRVLLAVCQAG